MQVFPYFVMDFLISKIFITERKRVRREYKSLPRTFHPSVLREYHDRSRFENLDRKYNYDFEMKMSNQENSYSKIITTRFSCGNPQISNSKQNKRGFYVWLIWIIRWIFNGIISRRHNTQHFFYKVIYASFLYLIKYNCVNSVFFWLLS